MNSFSRWALRLIAVLTAGLMVASGPALEADAAMSTAADCNTHNAICLFTLYNGYGTVLLYHPSTIAGGRRLPPRYQNKIHSARNNSGEQIYLHDGVACNGLTETLYPHEYAPDLSVGFRLDGKVSSISDYLTGDGAC